MREKEPMPIETLLRYGAEVSPDFNDDAMGWCSWCLDGDILTIRFERDEGSEAYEGNDWASAEYKFKLIDTKESK